ncbi:DUF6626 family protein [Magnetospirillum sp. SS-4]|uniref:DUF6626 family protein n=1 Tax=Magnetospirillum sp. SS-4 TaxID=2681465 RepID=UPI001385E120|nr:DUF6626 family protein [Magnetospirillum sp. SS-4]CAA7620393.1 conserved hypothetical protein [Magnetospirillum sp. SS-4]
MNALQHAYITLKSNDLTDGQYDFSRKWLGRDRSYYGSMKARQRQAGLRTMLALAGNLTKALVRAKAERRGNDAAVLEKLSGRIWDGVMAGRA